MKTISPLKRPSWAKPYLFDGYPGLHFPYYQADGKNGEMHYRAGTLPLSDADRALVVDLYDGELLRLNAMLKTLRAAWGEREGIVVVTSDHGEYLGEHKRIGHGVELHPTSAIRTFGDPYP